jgi:hypothetical protein
MEVRSIFVRWAEVFTLVMTGLRPLPLDALEYSDSLMKDIRNPDDFFYNARIAYGSQN